MQVGEVVELTLDGLSARGDGTGPLDGREVHVAGAFPTERVRARVEAISRQHARAFASLEAVLTAHAARREPPCPRHAVRGGACTGCPLMAVELDAQRAMKRERARALGLPVEGALAGAGALGYRWSSKRVAGGRAGALTLGSYVRGTHEVADMRGCLVDHPRITEVADAIADAASALGVPPYREGRGDLRYVWLKTDGARVLATLVTAKEESEAPAIARRLESVAAFAWSVQPSSGNAIRGDAPRALAGEPWLDVAIGGRASRVGPLGFLQPSPAVAAMAYDALLGDARGAPYAGRLAFDLYAGAGVTTARLRERFAEVVPCEAFPESAAALGVAPEDAATFVARQLGREVDLVVANPPRAGLGADVVAGLARLAPAHLAIMSCEPASLARDLDALTATFVLERVQAFDTLPQTPHLELVAHLSRRDPHARLAARRSDE
ncbi:MAG: class I SAM-dependent RNA methyltransferase [Sandaracinaceae bacterium]|nr:class I SAM-dependent RNA methyltransferase [Sandaracinaceae bacterium]